MFAALALAVLSLAAPPRVLGASPAKPAAPPRPHIVWKPIPFGPKRRAEMAAYSKKHYGIDSWHLHPKVIVEHYTGGESFSAAWHTFASNRPDPELGELPGTCAHFIVAKNGTIYQLVRLSIMCRHTVGLNYVAIGIEHVGTSDREILHDKKQITASLELTAWLHWRFHIKIRNIIGHNESLSSPYHREHYKPWAHQTHQDWKHADMRIYRKKLRALINRDRHHHA